MKTSTKIAIAFVTLAGLAGTTAMAADRYGKMRERAEFGMQQRIEQADADKSGDISLEEFTAAFKERFANADANKDGKLTVAEIAAEIERQRTERMASRFLDRFDVNNDGELTAEEIDSRQQKIFALMDSNDDGKIAVDEMPHRRGYHGGGHWGGHHGRGGYDMDDGGFRHHRGPGPMMEGGPTDK